MLGLACASIRSRWLIFGVWPQNSSVLLACGLFGFPLLFTAGGRPGYGVSLGAVRSGGAIWWGGVYGGGPTEEVLVGGSSSARMVVSAPMSFGGSKARLSDLLWRGRHPALKAVVSWWLLPLAVLCAWVAVVVWYGLFGLFMFPYRLVRRGSRKRKREDMRHQEMVEAVRSESGGPAEGSPREPEG